MFFKIFKKYYIIVIIAIFLNSCSNIKDTIDLAGVIDKTEELIFGEKDDTAPDKQEKSQDELDNSDYEQDTYPDISSVPQERPDFSELDKNFFEGEVPDSEENLDTTQYNNDNEKSSDSVEISEQEVTIATLVNRISNRVRVNVKKLLTFSDPPTSDIRVKKIEEKQRTDKFIPNENNKIAIIQFANNAIVPDTSAEDVIKAIVDNYNKNKIILIGHSSSSGGDTQKGKRLNMEISFSRAETIKSMLINKGFIKENIFTQGKGDLEPLNQVSKKYGDAANRRVEVFFINDN